MHLDLFPVELPGFKVHLKLAPVEDIPRIPKSIWVGLKMKVNFISSYLDLILPSQLRDKVTWFEIHHDLVCPVPRFPTDHDGAQVNIIGKQETTHY